MKMGRGRFENLKLLIFTLSLVCHLGTSAAFDIAEILDAYPQFSLLNQLLTLTKVGDEINSKSGLTLFAPPNGLLSNFQSGVSNSVMRDVLRHHVATDYLDFQELQGLIADLSVSTFLRTTGPDAVIISNHKVLGTVINNTFNTTLVSSITQLENQISIIEIDQVLRPVSIPSLPVTSSDPLVTFNITRTLSTLEDFTIFQLYLEETGVDSLLEGRQGTEAGCTIFAPTDAAFNALPGTWFQDLNKNDQRLLMEYHSLDKFFSLGDLWELVHFPVETIASTLSRTGSYILYINSTDGVVNIRAGDSNTTITSTLYQSDPVIIFAIDSVLLPRELFGLDFAFAPSSGESPAPTPAYPAASSPISRDHKSVAVQAPTPANSGGVRHGNTRTALVSTLTWMAFLLLSLQAKTGGLCL